MLSIISSFIPHNDKNYVSFWASSFFIYTIRFLDFAIIAWLLTNVIENPASVGLLIFFKFIPMLFVGLFTGWLADKYLRSRIIKISIILTSIYLLVWYLYLSYFSPTENIILLLVFVSGVIISIDRASRTSYLSNLVNKKYLRNVLALDVVATHLGWFLGPNIASILFEYFSYANIYMLLAIINLFNLALLLKLPKLDLKKSVHLSGITQGIKFVSKNKIILGTLLILGIGNFTAFTFESMTPYFAKFIFNTSPKQFNFMLSLQGLGALVGSLIFLPLVGRMNYQGIVFVLATITLLLGSIIFSTVDIFILACFILFSLGIIMPLFMNMHTMILMSQTPNQLRGRIQGFQQLAISMFPLGSLTLGFIGNKIGIIDSIKLFSIIGLILVLFVWIIFRSLNNRIKP